MVIKAVSSLEDVPISSVNKTSLEGYKWKSEGWRGLLPDLPKKLKQLGSVVMVGLPLTLS